MTDTKHLDSLTQTFLTVSIRRKIKLEVELGSVEVVAMMRTRQLRFRKLWF